jgi:acyl carrier protein
MSLQNSPACETVPSREQIAEDVKRIVADFSEMPREEIRESHLLFEDLGWDSLDLVECSMEVEEEYGISVSDDLVEKVKRVSDIIDGVLALLTKPQTTE